MGSEKSETQKSVKSIKSGCAKNPDGTYDMEMVIEFFPQRWFYLGLLISATKNSFTISW